MSVRDRSWISDWNAEDEKFWESEGKFVARWNLIWSIVAEHLGFSIWLIWSSVAAKLPQAGFYYTTEQLFQLVALPGLVGSLMRFPYTFAVPRFGGRYWTMTSAALLFIPATALAYFGSRPQTPFGVMLIAAATAGLGGGNFASSMANISFFYPDRMKGWALGLPGSGLLAADPDIAAGGIEALFGECRADVAAADCGGTVWRIPLHEQSRLGAIDIAGPAGHCQAKAHLGDGLALHRNVRFLYRLFGGISTAP
jgi:MFS family permease